MSITNRGWGWDIRHSLWVIWTLTEVFGFVAFLYIGSRAKKKKWVYWGLAYIIIPILGLTGALISPEKGSSIPSEILVFASLGLSLFCVGHAFFALPEYLRALNFLQTGFSAPAPGAKDAGRTQFPLPAEASSEPAGGTGASTKSAAVAPDVPGRKVEVAMVDINEADAPALASLPGMDEELARQAIEARSAHGTFASVEAFCEELGLDEGRAAGLEPHVICGLKKQEPGDRPGRKVDY